MLFYLGSVNLQILIQFELRLDGDDVFGVSDLPVMGCFEILLKLVQFDAQFFPLLFYLLKFLQGFQLRFKIVLSHKFL